MKKRLLISLFLIVSLLLSACGINDGETKNNDYIGNTEMIENTKMTVTIKDKVFISKLYDNATAHAFLEMLPLTLDMSAMAHEKYFNLSSDLPTAAFAPKTINEGDIMLWNSNCLVLFYESFSTTYSYTKIGKIEDTAGLAAALGVGNISVTFTIGEIKE